ncbi:biopolymer transporter ExbD [Bacteroidales bacterium OttesenSCG-928-M06]|nr:biopolymer transporter ExbD [Bacteroidales bacterium OttesenSCG-928-M06]
MSRFRRSAAREVPALNTAALPDLIFTILFFFMIVTNMRPVPVVTQFDLPEGTELQKLEERSSVVYIMVGKPLGGAGVRESIQLNSEFVTLSEMPSVLDRIKKNELENSNQLVVVLKADKDVQMKLISDIKECLRELGLLTVHYSVEKKKY